MADSENKPTVFICYSHEDKKWLKRLQVMLSPLPHEAFDDTCIKPGSKWYPEIQEALGRATVAVLLVSPGFLASDFIKNEELPRIHEAADNGKLTILWVLLKTCMYEETPLKEYEAVHDVSMPLDSLSKPKADAVLKKLCKAIKHAAKAPPSGRG